MQTEAEKRDLLPKGDMEKFYRFFCKAALVNVNLNNFLTSPFNSWGNL
jgi:hypothetical protein